MTSSRPNRGRWSAVARAVALGVVATACSAVPAAAVTASHRLTIDGALADARPAAGGAIRVIVSHASKTRASTVVTTIGPRGALGIQSPLLSSSYRFPRSGSTALTSRGAIAAYDEQTSRGRRAVKVVSLTAGGRVGRPTRLSDPAASARDPEAMAGGGAAGVVFTQHRRRHPKILEWAYRPAGRTAFLPARPLTGPASSEDFRYVVAMGPHGAGAVLETTIFAKAAFRVRRLATDGSVGPWITVSDEGYGDGNGALSITPDGTIAIGITASRTLADGREETSFLSTSLPPRATAVTPVQLLTTHIDPAGDGGGTLPDDSFAIATGRANTTAIATVQDDSNRLQLFTGRAGALAETGAFEVKGISPAHLVTVTPDGGVTAVWSPSNSFRAQPIFASHASPGGRFSRPRSVARTTRQSDHTELDPTGLAPYRGASALLSYQDDDLKRSIDHLVVLSP